VRVLVACECSGVVRDAFRARGHDAWSCDTKPSESWQPVVFAADLPKCDCCEDAWCPKHNQHFADCPCLGPTQDDVQYREIPLGHYVGGVLEGSAHFQCDVREVINRGWDLMIAHPPCTYLSVSGLHWNKRRPGRDKLTEEALDFVRFLMDAPIPRIAIENPVSCISTRIRKPSQIIQPWQFGEDASKATCLWLKQLPPLMPTKILPGGRKARRANQCPSGQNKLGPSPERAAERAKTYPGIAAAMAEQWGRLDLAPAGEAKRGGE